jgi:Xaa-Pro aminopeptidase
MKALTRPVLLVGCAPGCPDIEYISAFRAHDPVALLVTARGISLVVPELEFGRALDEVAEGVTVCTPQSLGLRGRRLRDPFAWAVGLVRRERLRRVRAGQNLPLGAARELQRGGIRVECAHEPLFPQRAIKRPDELARIAEVQQAAVIAMRAAVTLIAASRIDPSRRLNVKGSVLTSEIVRRRIAAVLLDHDCFCRDAIVAGGPASADPHKIGTGPLMAGQPIVIDIFPQHLVHGYWGDLTRTVVRGACSSRLVQMYKAVKAAQAAALQRIRPGVKASSVHNAAADEMRNRGFATELRDGQPAGFIHGAGHGVGLEIHEEPRVGRAGDRLRRGHVITVEPGLYYPDIGGIRIEDTVAVTTGGWRYLAPCEHVFKI